MQRANLYLLLMLLVNPALSMADDASDMAKMQRKLNAETMQKPFAVEDAAKIDSYVNEAMKKNLQPRTAPPSYWRPGYTCNSIYGNSWTDYRDCMYYHRYYGRYW